MSSKSSMRCQRIAITAVLFLGGFVGFPRGQERKAAPRHEGEALPSPPQQKAPWTPPKTQFPEVLITATTALFDAGLADPRGGEYRTIRVAIGSCWSGDAGELETHGWLLPSADQKQRFAVGWNGLVYPVVAVGEPADLRADIGAILAADIKARAKVAPGEFNRWVRTRPEKESLSHVSFVPLKVCLLLRIGEGELAEAYWTAWAGGLRPNVNDNDTHRRDPYLLLATNWVWARFDRALCAHMRGDDRLACADAHALVGNHQSVKAQAEKRGFQRREDFVDGQPRPLPHFDFLDQLSTLAVDQARRARLSKRPELPKDADKARRIAALIADLDNVAVRQFSQPGGVDLSWDLRVRQLIDMGNDAVEPLLDCLEKDNRLTRSVHFHRDFFRHRMILGVHEAAYVALAGILQTSFFSFASTGDDLTARGEEGRTRVAANIRAYWERFKNVPLEERWYLLLKDDKVRPAHWLQASRNITRSVNVSESPASMFGASWVEVTEPEPGEKPSLRGEVLRKQNSPTVTELLIRRIDTIRARGAPGSERLHAIYDACQMAEHLAAWDSPASAPALAKMVQGCREQIKDGSTYLLGRSIAIMTELRQQAGDARALDDYAHWIRGVHPEKGDRDWEQLLRPMWRNSDHPAIVAAAKSMFEDDTSPWCERFLRRGGTYDLFATPMLGLASFRKRLLVELTDQSPTGKIKLDEEGLGFIEATGAYSGGAAVHAELDPLSPGPSAEVTFRVCDYHAFRLARAANAPRCELYWPAGERDRAIGACVAFLAKYGERFKYSPLARTPDDWSHKDPCRMAFPLRDRPATAQETERGEAIFSLEGSGPARVWKLPALPMPATWITLKDHPYLTPIYDAKGQKIGARTEHEQRGFVWQAEEVMQHGRWRRYYGFVGSSKVAKVPAEEIEFPAGYDWANLSDGIDCQLIDSSVEKLGNGMLKLTRPAVGGPVLVRVQLRNRFGIERALPVKFVRTDAKTGPALHPGIKFRLQHLTAAPGLNARQIASRADDESAWQDIALKRQQYFQSKPATRLAAPAEVFAEFSLDLSEWFELKNPGNYRLQLEFDRRAGGFAEGRSLELQFSLGPK